MQSPQQQYFDAGSPGSADAPGSRPGSAPGSPPGGVPGARRRIEMVAAEEVDELIKKLEHDCERQVATRASAVKGVAAERDLLKTAELSRDLFKQALSGEKENLVKIFGGSCERIGRLRIALDQVTISEMHANDDRWKDLKFVVGTIETVLKDLGTFKPWVPPAAKPPESIAYKGVRRRVSPGRRVNWKPEVEGGEVSSWEVDPAFPANLEFSTVSGVISGNLAPHVEVEEATYTVVARNDNGEATTTVVFAVLAGPPIALAYPTAVQSIVVGNTVLWKPEVQGNFPTSWSVQPPFPEGLVLDPESGVIQGTAHAISLAEEHTVTGSNASGKVTSTFRLEVQPAPPSSLCYPEVPEKLTAGRMFEFVPEVRGVPTEWLVAPDLPEGMSLDLDAGVISGTPRQVREQGSWIVTASNAAGSARCEVTFSVQLAPPSNLEYSTMGMDLLLQRPFTLSCTVEGAVEAFAVEPALPEGLAIDTAIGTISGTPLEITEERDYHITARNPTASATTCVTLTVVMGPPSALRYPTLGPRCEHGVQVSAFPEIEGIATKFVVVPELPRGLSLDEATGEIRGTPTTVIAEALYAVTASNDDGACWEEISFAVVPPVPIDLSYPEASSTYVVGESLTLEPRIEQWVQGTFTIDRPLPVGIKLDKKKGIISGTPEDVAEEARYFVTASNISGSTRAELVFAVVEAEEETIVDPKFAELVEAVVDLADLPPEPSHTKAFGDWMIWMVHRVHLNDPDLVEVNFNSQHMPLPHIEARIAPKLCKAIEFNTHLEILSLSNANLMKNEGVDLAHALAVNKTLRTLNVDNNSLDSNIIRELALAIGENADCAVEHLRLSPQKQVDGFFGRPVEEAVGSMMDKNAVITKLGFECNDAHWRNAMNRALLRNNDRSRRWRKANDRLNSDASDKEVGLPEERGLSRLVLRKPPAKAAAEVFADDTEKHILFRRFVSQQKRLPNATQFKSSAMSSGCALKYSEVRPLILECRSRMLDAAVGSEVTVADVFEVDTQGELHSWSGANDMWNIQIRTSERKRYLYKSNKELVLFVSDEWAEWLGAGQSAS